VTDMATADISGTYLGTGADKRVYKY